jgi:hypothetical protein
MKIPNADRAVIAQDKLCDYLLNVEHEWGGSKAKLLLAMGYDFDNWQRLENDLRTQHLTMEVDCMVNTDYGPRYEILAALVGPAGRSVNFRSVWANRHWHGCSPLDYNVLRVIQWNSNFTTM